MAKTKESEHNQIIHNFKNYLTQNFGLSISEYNDEGKRLDIFSTNMEGVTVLIEVIWKNDYKYDMMNVLDSNHNIKVVITKPSNIVNKNISRDFNKRIINERKKGYALLGLFDGTGILNNDETYMKMILTEMLENINIIDTKMKFEFEYLFDYHLNKFLNYFNSGDILESNTKLNELIKLIFEEIDRQNYSLILYPIKLLFKSVYNLEPDRITAIKEIINHSYKDDLILFSYVTDQFNNIMMESWVEKKIEMAIICAKMLLELGRDYLSVNFVASAMCHIPIDNVCGDFFVPELFAYQILFGSLVHDNQQEKPENYQNFLDEVAHAIEGNLFFSYDAFGPDENYYLIEAIKIAKTLEKAYKTNIDIFLQYYNINENMTAHI